MSDGRALDRLAFEALNAAEMAAIAAERLAGRGDKIAAAALRKSKFKPAQSNANKAVDFEIRYEYVFRLAN